MQPQSVTGTRNGAGPPADNQRRRPYAPVVVAACLPLVALLILFAFDVPIGQPFFLIYRYSSFALLRIIRAMPAMALGLVGVAVLYHGMVHGCAPFTRGTKLAALLCYTGLAAWFFVAPPSFVKQHAFNLLSPSHEGAFVLEAREIESVRAYVSRDFYARLQKTPEEMRGRRILSNPPGMTVASAVLRRWVENSPRLRSGLVRMFDLHDLDDPRQQTEFAAALLLGIFLTAAWGTAIVPAYWLCRLWLPELAAICVAFAAVFNPTTATFTPGKDPAQLMTVLLILYGWLAAYSRRNALYGAIAGIALAAGTMVGLIHIGIMAIVGAATLLHALVRRHGIREWVTCCAVPSALAALAIGLIAYAGFDWNLARTVQNVAARYAEIQLPTITDPFYWTLVGLPMFLLFVGPLFWAQLIALREKFHDDAELLGRALLLCAIAVMTYSYFFANNSETPRLWVPFTPLLLLGLALRRRAFRDNSLANRLMMLLLIGLQLAVTLAFWTLMDVRESEWRLLTGRMWN